MFKNMDGEENRVIFICDDCGLTRELVASLFSLAGYKKNKEFSSGVDLLKYINTSNSTIPQMIIIDYEMPVLNGFETICRIREVYKNILIVMLTSYELPIDLAVYLKINGIPVIKKPITKGKVDFIKQWAVIN